MTKDQMRSIEEALDLALEALENSVDLVREDAYNAEQLYGKYPSRQARVQGLKVLADDHEKAITAIKQARALDKKADNAMIYKTFEQWMNGDFLEVGEPRKKAYSKDELLLVEMGWNYGYDAGRAVEQALDKKADNARELGLDYEPAKKQRWAVFCRVCKKEWSVSYQHPGKSICADCDDAPLAHLADHSEQYLDMVKAQTAPVQEPVGKVIASVPHLRSISVELLPEAPVPSEDSLLYTTPPAAQQDIQRLSALVRAQQITIDKLEAAQPAPVQSAERGEPVATKLETQQFNCFHVSAEDFQRLKALPVGAKLYTTPPAAQRQWVGLTTDDVWGSNEVMALNAEMGLTIVQIMTLMAWANAKLKEKNT